MPLTDRPSGWYNSRLWGPAIPAIFVVCLAISPGLGGFVLALVILAILMMLAKVAGDKAKGELEISNLSATGQQSWDSGKPESTNHQMSKTSTPAKR